MAEPLRDVKAAAAFLGIPPKSLYDMTAARTVPFTRVGKHIRFTQEHLDAIVAAGEEPVVVPAPRFQVVGGHRIGTHPPSGPSTPPPPSGPKLFVRPGKVA